jgi:hypothetical protein
LHSRQLSFEPLEGRDLLAVFTVTNLNDAPVNGAGQAPGTLRQAVFDANATPAIADEIQFAAGLNGTIQLTQVASQAEGASALVVSSPITIRGNTSGITIARAAAAPEMRIFLVTGTGNLSLESTNVTGGVARGAVGAPGSNGGDGRGGAVFNSGTLQVLASTLCNNVAIGGSPGAGAVTGQGLGGAIYNNNATLTIRNATLSGNQALNSSENTASWAFGGGIYGLNGNLTIYNSTITDSNALTGRGLYVVAVGEGEAANAVIHSTIIGQSDELVYDLFASYEPGGTVNVAGANNLIRRQNDFLGITVSTADPSLNPLANYGGPTLTHALQTESSAIDNGSNVLNLTTDQRGTSFARNVGDGVDIGAFESSSVAPLLLGDYNRDTFVNAADYVLWRKLADSSVAAFALADGDGSGDIDGLDYDVWEENFGETLAASPTFNSAEMNVPAIATTAPRPERNSRQFYVIATNEVEVRPSERTTLPIETRSLDDDARDEALLALLTTWDGAARGKRVPISFE